MSQNVKIKHLRSNIKGKKPDVNNLDYGEIAVNYNKDNEFLSVKNSKNEIITFSSDKKFESFINDVKIQGSTIQFLNGNTVVNTIALSQITNDKSVKSASLNGTILKLKFEDSTKPDIDVDLKSLLNDYIKSSEVDTKIKNATSDKLTRSQADEAYVGKSDLNAYATKAELSGKQDKGDYATKAELATKQAKGDYITKTTADSTYQPKGDYITTEDGDNRYLTQAKGDVRYMLKTENPGEVQAGSTVTVENENSGIIEIDGVKKKVITLDNDVTSSSKNGVKSSGIYKAINNAVSDKISKSTADNTYQPKGDYITKTKADQTYQSKGSYATKMELNEYVTKTDASSTYQPKGDYATKAELSGKQDKGDYLTKSDASSTYQPKGNYATEVYYDPDEKMIYLKNESGENISHIDATDFIKDGMVESVEIKGGNLVITFNTDSGKKPITLSLAKIFNPNNYYDKTNIDNKLNDYVKKESGKGLSENNFTTAYKNKLESLSNYTLPKASTTTLGGIKIGEGINVDGNGMITSEIRPIQSVIYKELKGLKDDSKLIPGQLYRITDYVTTTTQANTKSAGHIFDVVVLAIGSNVLSEHASAMIHDNDKYFANYPTNLSAWELKYDIENDKEKYEWADDKNGKGVIYYMKDEWGNEAYYDFKNIMCKKKTTTKEGEDNADEYYYLFNCVDDNNKKVDMSVVYNQKTIKFAMPCVFLIENNVLKPSYYCSVLSPCREERQFHKVINYCIYNYNIKSIMEFHKAKKNIPLSSSFEIINNKIGYNCNAITFECESISEDYNVNLSFKNNKIGNDCSYNIINSNCNSNIFGNGCVNNELKGNCNSNIFGDYCTENTLMDYCDSNIFGNNCLKNEAASNCNSNIFGDYCTENTLMNYCDNNTFGYACKKNNLGINSESITSQGECKNNILMDNCENNTFGYGCKKNNLGKGCKVNYLGKNCEVNYFSDDCKNNTFGDSCKYNRLGNECKGNKLIAGNCSSNLFYDKCEEIELGNSNVGNIFGFECGYITLKAKACSLNVFGGLCKYIQSNQSVYSITVQNGISGTDEDNKKDISRVKSYMFIGHDVDNNNEEVEKNLFATNQIIFPSRT